MDDPNSWLAFALAMIILGLFGIAWMLSDINTTLKRILRVQRKALPKAETEEWDD